MGMSQSTSTFLACFSGFWLVWALVVMLCCFCSFLQRRLKRRQEERLQSTEVEPPGSGYPPVASAPPPLLPPLHPPLPATAAAPPPAQLPPREPLPRCTTQTMSPPIPLPVPHPMPQATWVSMPDGDFFGNPPCYEEAVLMEDPPPPYSEVLADPRGGTYLKPTPLRATAQHLLPLRIAHHDPAPAFPSETSKPPSGAVFTDRGYSSLIRLPSSQRWDSLGHLLSNMELNHNHQSPPGVPHSLQAGTMVATMPRREPRTLSHEGFGLHSEIQGLQHLQGRIPGLPGGVQGFQRQLQGFQGVHGLGGLDPGCGMPMALPLLGRSTAV
ncbi:unnamed protein product [Ophioblennius macclurei]